MAQHARPMVTGALAVLACEAEDLSTLVSDARGQGFFKSYLSVPYLAYLGNPRPPRLTFRRRKGGDRALMTTEGEQAQLVEMTAHEFYEHNFDVEKMMNVMATR